MLTRSANASPIIPGFHYAPSHSPHQSPSRISAAAVPAAVRRLSLTSSPLLSAGLNNTSIHDNSPCYQHDHRLRSTSSSPALASLSLQAQPQPQPQLPLASTSSASQSSLPPRRYVAVDVATQYSPMEPFDYAAHPVPPHQAPSSLTSQPPSKQSTPHELPPTPGPVPMEPGIEQGVDRSGASSSNATGVTPHLGTHHISYQPGSAQTQPQPSQPQQNLQSRPAPGARAPVSDRSVSVSASASSSSTSTSTSKLPSSSTLPTTSSAPSSSTGPLQQQQQQRQPTHTTSPQKRRSSQGPFAQEGAEGEDQAVAGPSASPSVTHSPGSAKRIKPDVAPPKILPERYELCPVEDMVVLIANMLGELIETNDALALKSGHLTRFHSRTAPGISVLDYLHRLAKHATLTPPLLLSMVYYIDRLCAMYPDFTINTLTVHRFLITAATVAAKGLSDSFWNNSTYARVGGVRVAELKMLELEFLYRLEWKIVPNPEVLAAYYRPLVERCPGYALPPDHSSASRDEEDMSDDLDEDDDDGDKPDDGAPGNGGSSRGGSNNAHNRQTSTSLIGKDMVDSGLTKSVSK